jgi:hypothetical protein
MAILLMNLLASANGHHDFQFIPISQLLGGKHAARHDFPVPLQRDALAAQAHFLEKHGHAGGIGKLSSRAVNADGNQFILCRSIGPGMII